jgi:hypothetical protein
MSESYVFHGFILAYIAANCQAEPTGWRRVKLCDTVSDTDESQSCALRQPA